MFDNFLVAFEDQSDALIAYALSAAEALDALPSAIADDTPDERGTRARHSLRVLAKAAKAAGIAAEIFDPDGPDTPTHAAVPRFARTFDFVMASQREPGRPPGRDDLTTALLSESGRPVWVVPAIQRAPAKFDRVLIAWDGGAAAAGAFSAALPIFARAGQVDIVTVGSAAVDEEIVGNGERLKGRLLRSGVAAEFRRLPGGGDPADVLLSYAADAGADLMACGGYSHSRLRESLFGGATRTFLTGMTLPVFFVH
jgi:nucleotide-binding universal stress UspA family protein